MAATTKYIDRDYNRAKDDYENDNDIKDHGDNVNDGYYSTDKDGTFYEIFKGDSNYNKRTINITDSNNNCKSISY